MPPKKRTNIAAVATRQQTKDPKRVGEHSTTAIRTKPVRVTLDLPPDQYAELETWLVELSGLRGKRTKFSQAGRALLALVIEDDALTREVVGKIDEMQ